MSLAVTAYLVWFLVLVVALASIVRGGRVAALLGALVAYGLVAATVGLQEQGWPVASWKFLGLMAGGVAGLALFVASILRGKAPESS